MATLKFKGNYIPCTVMQFQPGAFEHVAARTHFAGLHGISEIRLGSGARMIEIPVLLHAQRNAEGEVTVPGWSTRDALNSYIRVELNVNQHGKNGTLEYESDEPDWNIDEADCTFEGFTRTSNDIHDDAGTAGGGWVCFGILRYTQLVR